MAKVKKTAPKKPGKKGPPKGVTNNPNGRPKKGLGLADWVRNHPDIPKVIDKVVKVAKTLNTKNEHPQARDCAKMLMDKTVPTLRTQELDVQGGLEIKMPTITIQKAK